MQLQPVYLQRGFSYPDARYLDALVYGQLYLETDFLYVILTHLTGIRNSAFRIRTVWVFSTTKHCLTINFASFNFDDTPLNTIER